MLIAVAKEEVKDIEGLVVVSIQIVTVVLGV